MESTTLVTFMLDHPTARHVELLGSWDNFSEPWEMKRDRRRGNGIWTGCHKFRNIICDGDSNGIHEKRDGALKMGGTYWYYYRIDRDEEYYDPSQPTTKQCPFLPSQPVNVLDVPREKRFVSRSRSSSVSLITAVQTLNPDDRFLNPRPPPKPRLPKIDTALASGSTLRPWTTNPAPSSTSASNNNIREARSAPPVPTNILSNALAHLKSPTGTTHKSSTRRTHPIRLFSTHRRSRTVQHPITNPRFRLAVPKSSPVPRLRSSPLEETSTGKTPTSFLVSRGRAVTAPDVSISTPSHSRPQSHRRAWSHEQLIPAPKRPSRSPSPLRQLVAPHEPIEEVVDLVPCQEHFVAPRTATNSTESTHTVLSPGPLKNEPPHIVSPVDKELPALPSYLIPEPLFANHHSSKPFLPDYSSFDDFLSVEDDDNDDAESLHVLQSRFSAWSVVSASASDAEGDDDDDDDELDGAVSSPTFSSIRDSTGSQAIALVISEAEDEKPETGEKLPADSWKACGEPEKEKKGTQMQQLLDEFDYLGAALL